MVTLWATLMRDDKEIGDIAIRRAVSKDREPGTVSSYGWLVKEDGQSTKRSTETTLVQHREGDPEWMLVAAVLDKAGYA